MSDQQIYRLRAPASGREALAPAREGIVYRDEDTGEELEPVAVVLPLAATSTSKLARSPINLTSCRRCQQLVGRDLESCEFCGLSLS